MYKAIEIREETKERLRKLAKGLLMDIITHRISEGIMDEDPDGHYAIDPSDAGLRVNVWVNDTYNDDDYIERMEVKQICIDDDIYLVVGDEDEEVYLHSLPFDAIIDICNELEDIWDAEEE